MGKSEAKEKSRGIDERKMTNVISIDQMRKGRWRRDKRYRKALERLGKKLTGMGEQLFDLAFELAVEGAWREWNDGVPNGTEIYINEVILRESGDPNVSRLIDAQEYLYGVASELSGPAWQARVKRSKDDKLLDELIKKENRHTRKDENDDMHDYVDFMTGEGKYKD